MRVMETHFYMLMMVLACCFCASLRTWRSGEAVACGGFDAGMARGAADDGHVDAGGEGRGMGP